MNALIKLAVTEFPVLFPLFYFEYLSFSIGRQVSYWFFCLYWLECGGHFSFHLIRKTLWNE